VETERELLARVGGGCNLPLGARCTRSESALVLEVAMGSRAWSPGEAVVIQRIEVRGDSPREVAERAFASLQTEATDSPESTARVLLTATESVAARQARALRALGLAVVSAPLLRTVSVADNQAMDAAVASLTADSWLLFASGTGVRTFFDRISQTALPLGLHCGAIGPATGDLLVEHGLSADFIPEITTSEGFVAEFPACQEGAVPGHFLLPRAEGGRDVMAEALRARGHRVEELVTYRSEAVQDEDLASLLAMDYDFVVFSSPSGVEAYIERVGEGVPTAPRWVSLGATTTARLRKEGFTEVLQLARPTPECLAQEILEQVALGDAGS
jgi:uroporphyrinogen-III synthase